MATKKAASQSTEQQSGDQKQTAQSNESIPAPDDKQASEQESGVEDAAQNTEQQTGDQAQAAQSTDNTTAPVDEQAAEQKPAFLLPHRYTGRSIKHFDHNRKFYQLVPNTVCRNLPAEAEQVKRLIKQGELVTI